ncbi:DUF6586 family protein [Dasania marina]|uniref:DUF6586 family protein n=1 Tax=Dasania marina TaxID=471499 RepID=UPI000379486B|nr:DUF6586 family protein [Dasania marina]
MANTLRDEVNLRLYCCRLQLEFYQQRLAAAELPVNVIRCWAGEAGLAHLQRAYQAYLLELAQAYNVVAAGVTSARQLAPLMAAQNIIAAEMTQLCELEANEASWLSRLLAPTGAITAATTPQASSPDQIRLTALMPSMLDLEALQASHEALSQLIESQRSFTQEW